MPLRPSSGGVGGVHAMRLVRVDLVVWRGVLSVEVIAIFAGWRRMSLAGSAEVYGIFLQSVVESLRWSKERERLMA